MLRNVGSGFEKFFWGCFVYVFYLDENNGIFAVSHKFVDEFL